MNNFHDEQKETNDKSSWDFGQYLRWVDCEMENLNWSQEKHKDKIWQLTYNFGEFLFHIWMQKNRQIGDKIKLLEYWKEWADEYNIPYSNFDYLWHRIFI